MRARGRRVPRWTAAPLVMAISVAIAATVAAAATVGVATVDRHAVRGTQVQVTDTVPPPGSCDRVVVIGDSLTDNSEPWIRSELAAAGYEYFVDAQPSRRIPGFVRAPYSGVKAALAVRASFGEADCWMVGLGSNDLVFGGDEPAAAAAMIDEMLAALTPGAAVWWINVNYGWDSRTSFDFPRATRAFNAVLDAVAAERDGFVVVDWYAYSAANPQWFFDPVHVDRTGSIARAEFTIAALPPPRR